MTIWNCGFLICGWNQGGHRCTRCNDGKRSRHVKDLSVRPSRPTGLLVGTAAGMVRLLVTTPVSPSQFQMTENVSPLDRARTATARVTCGFTPSWRIRRRRRRQVHRHRRRVHRRQPPPPSPPPPSPILHRPAAAAASAAKSIRRRFHRRSPPSPPPPSPPPVHHLHPRHRRHRRRARDPVILRDIDYELEANS